MRPVGEKILKGEDVRRVQPRGGEGDVQAGRASQDGRGWYGNEGADNQAPRPAGRRFGDTGDYEVHRGRAVEGRAREPDGPVPPDVPRGQAPGDRPQDNR